MCPDAELLSAWADGEVPAPWRDRIAAHLEACAPCAARVASWRLLSERLRSDGPRDEAAMVSRIGERIEAALAADRPMAGSRAGAVRPRSRVRRFELSVPLAAAAALALVFAGGLSGGLLARAGGPAGGKDATLASTAAPISASANMDALVRYLESQNAPLNITIQMPSVSLSQTSGDPMIVKMPPMEMVSFPPSGSPGPTTPEN
jgi:anti-sigma factor RsiW